MEWILNNLSLENRFASINDFLDEITEFLKFKQANPLLKSGFLCPREIRDLKVVNNISFSQAVMSSAPKDLKYLIMSWVDKNGPFWSDDRASNDDDYFEYNQIDVTEMGLGECARREIIKSPICSFSFSGIFEFTPISIQHGLKEEVLGNYEVENLWSMEQLLLSAESSLPEPNNWKTAIGLLKHKHTKLVFADALLDQISQLPYNSTVYTRMGELCRVLEEYLGSRDLSGALTETTHELLHCHFHGEKAWFSDESDKDVNKFKDELTFLSVRDNKRKLFRFHGKIKTPQVRVYFEWPIPPEQKDIQIVYFGPKITKK
jgi:hypothetical protein